MKFYAYVALVWVLKGVKAAVRKVNDVTFAAECKVVYAHRCYSLAARGVAANIAYARADAAQRHVEHAEDMLIGAKANVAWEWRQLDARIADMTKMLGS